MKNDAYSEFEYIWNSAHCDPPPDEESQACCVNRMKYNFVREQLHRLILNKDYKARWNIYLTRMININQYILVFECSLWSINVLLSIHYIIRIDVAIKLVVKIDSIYKNILQHSECPEPISTYIDSIFTKDINSKPVKSIGRFIIYLSNHDITSLIHWYDICKKEKYFENDFESVLTELKTSSPPK